MASGVYNIWKRESNDSTGPQWESTYTFRAMLITSTDYTFDPDLATVDDTSTSDLATNESSGTSYGGGAASTDRIQLATRTITQDDTNDLAVCDTTDIVFPSINISPAGEQVGLAVICEIPTTAPSDTTSLPVCYFDSTTLSGSATPVTTNGGNLTVTWSTNGVMTLS